MAFATAASLPVSGINAHYVAHYSVFFFFFSPALHFRPRVVSMDIPVFLAISDHEA